MEENARLIGGQQTVAHGEAYKLSDILQAQLGHDVGAMSLHGLDAEDQLIGDLLIGVSLGHQLQHFQLTRREDAQLPGDPLVLPGGSR